MITKEELATKPNILMKRQEDQELRIYFFVGNRFAQKETKVFYVTAFKLEEAFDLAKAKVADEFNLLYTAQNPTVREFLHELELESLAFKVLEKEKLKIPKIKVEKKELPKKELVNIKIASPVKMSFEKFRAGLLFCANEKSVIYQNKKDREILHQIVSGLKYKSN